jgi:hypothetical protein
METDARSTFIRESLRLWESAIAPFYPGLTQEPGPGAPAATWTDPVEIQEVLTAVGEVSYNAEGGRTHASIDFLPGAGTASHCSAGPGPIDGTIGLFDCDRGSPREDPFAVVAPEALYLYVPVDHAGHALFEWSYLWLDLRLVAPPDSMAPPLTSQGPYDEFVRMKGGGLGPRMLWDQGDESVASSPFTWYYSGAMVVFSKGSPYNMDRLSQWNARHGIYETLHESMGRSQFAGFIRGAMRSARQRALQGSPSGFGTSTAA